MTIYNPNKEERAFLYQEAQELEPLMKELGSLTVMVEESAHKYRVTFVVAPESVGMKVQATDANLIEATIAAKEEVARQLNAIVNAMPRAWNPDDKEGMKIPREMLH